MRHAKIITLSAVLSILGLSGAQAADGNVNNPAYNTDSSANPAPTSDAGVANPAAPSQGSMSAPTSSTAELFALTGIVQSIDKNNKSIQLQNADGATQTLVVGKSTQIMRDGQAVKLTQLKKGDSITVKNAAASM